MTETDIISHYSAQYLAQEQAKGRDAQPTDCYAIAGTDIWVWMEVVCDQKRLVVTAMLWAFGVSY